MDAPLLQTKLYIPPPRPNLVPRPRLTERLSAGPHSGRKLTLISAPAGFGKTTLVAEWLGGAERPVAWLSLDENDCDPARFLTYLVTALQRIDPHIGRAAQAMLQSPRPPPPDSLLTSLINDVAATPAPFVLILDDYHLIQAPPIHQQLAFLVEHQPPSMHLLIVTREDPPLPLSRWRAGGQMTDIRQADLKFTEPETADFLRRVMGLELSAADVSALHRRTEGWIAGLQLAALSMEGRDDVHRLVQAFTGSHRYILDYLIEEVFQRQPADLQDFLLRTSVLDRLTAPLCDAVAGRDDSRELLLVLEHANLFLIPFDESRQWYRYHRLFADLLRQQLHTSVGQDLAPDLHRRASRWYEANGFPAEAIHHALAAGDWERAGGLILAGGDTMLRRGEVMTLLGWLQALPDEVVRAHPALCLNYSWALILSGQLDAAESYLGQAEGAAPDDVALLGEIVSAQAYIARARGDDRRTIELSQRALSLLPEADSSARSIVAVNLGIAHWSSGHLADAEQALGEADRAAQQSSNTYARLTALGFLGVVQAAQGRLRQAAALLRQAIRLGDGSPAIALAHNELSALCYEWNDLAAAVEHLQHGIELGRRGGNVEIQIGSYRTLARVRQAQGDRPAALDALREAHRLARESDVPPLMHARNAACRVRIALAQDDLVTAMRWAEQVTQDADASPFYPLLGLTPARLLLAQHRQAEAAEELEALYETAARAGWQFGALEVRVLQSLAAETPVGALEFLAEGLALAQPEGFIRTFADAGEPLVPLLQEAARQGVTPDYVGEILAAIGAAPGAMPSDASPLVEPLSEREIEVLRLVAAGLTNREIAQKLIISLGTAKTHTHNLYGKLGVRNRAQAVARARELNLI